MTGVDTSFYPRPEPLSPLAVYGNVQSTGGQMLSNQQAEQSIQSNQMELAYKNALTQANAASIIQDGPQKGTLDVNKRNMLLSQAAGGGLHLQDAAVGALPLNAPTQYVGVDPQTGKPMARAAGAQSLSTALNPTAPPPALSQDQADSAHEAISSGIDQSQKLLQKPDLSRADIVSSMGTLMAEHPGAYDKAGILTELGTLSTVPDNVEGNRQYIQQHLSRFQQAKQQLDQLAPHSSQLPQSQNFQQALENPPAAKDINGMATIGEQLPLGTQEDTLQNVGRAQDLEKAAQASPARKAILGNLEAMNQQFTSGPLAHDINKTQKTVNEVTGIPIFGSDKIKAQEEFGKQAQQLAQQQFQTLGGTGTDAKLDSVISTSPSEMLSNLGNQGIIHLLKGNEDAITVMNQEWKQYEQAHGPSSYDQFVTQFNQKYDPRIFQAQYMNPDERKAMVGGMSPTERTAFFQKYDDAHANGWVK
jgi:hypothetical protein